MRHFSLFALLNNLGKFIKDFSRFAILDRSVLSPSGITTINDEHQHLYQIDKDGNGWALELYHEKNPKIKHKHEIKNWIVLEAQSNCFPECKRIYGHKGVGPHIHNINKK